MKNYISDYEAFDRDNTYWGNDLGVVTDGEITRFKIWAPLCTAVYLNLYTAGEGDNKIETLCMRRIENGVWYVEMLHKAFGVYYTYTLEFEYSIRQEVMDIYAKGCGINGERGYIPDFASLNPPDWDKYGRVSCPAPTDAVIYECHVRDFSINGSSGPEWYNRGRYTGFTVSGTACEGETTCLDHLKELGITHVQLLPVANNATVDEKKPYSGQYNWGYDPKNYMCPEGYYCTDPEDGDRRIRELKQLVLALHKAGIGVVFDVVFNHTFYTEESWFHKTVPYYYHRLDKNGEFSLGAGVCNETASERAMMRKYIVDAVKFWAAEYKADGFRFDLMAVHDIETINLIRSELNKIDPNILMYGEGWSGGGCAYPFEKLAYKHNASQFPAVGLFNDNIRDGIKGGTFNVYERGFVSGNDSCIPAVKRGIAGSCKFSRLNGTADDLAWAVSPAQSINYCEAHDNHTLWDKLCISAADMSDDDRKKMDKLAAAITILSQGVPFLQLGQDFLRTKPTGHGNGAERFNGNSYNAPDSVNMIRWERKHENIGIFKYYKGLIALRKSSPLFRMSSPEQLEAHLYFHDTGDIIAYELVDEKECYFIVMNNKTDQRWANLPNGVFYKRLDENGRPIYQRYSGSISVPPLSCEVYKRLWA